MAHIHDQKWTLEDIIESMNGKLWCLWYQTRLDRIEERCGCEIGFAGWNLTQHRKVGTGQIPVAQIHPLLRHGLNLQSGAPTLLVWITGA